MFDFQKELNNMRMIFRENKNKIKLPSPPAWLRQGDKLFDTFRYKDEIIREGNIYYGFIVQANTMLFKPKPITGFFPETHYPANLIYSTSKFAEKEPFILSAIASYLYSLKDDKSKPVPPPLQEIVDVIRDEYDRSSAQFSVGFNDTDMLDVIFLAMLVFRTFLPKKYLICPLLPIIAAPQHPDTVIILPKHLWTENFRNTWTEDSF